MLCFEEKDLPRLRELHQRGEKNHVRGLEILSGEALHRKEPALPESVYAALYAPTSAIVCPFGLTLALAENAAQNGCAFHFDTQVEEICRQGDHFLLRTDRGEVESRVVIAAAGVYADVFHNQLCENKIAITPRRGEYCLFDEVVAAGGDVGPQARKAGDDIPQGQLPDTAGGSLGHIGKALGGGGGILLR